MISKEEILNTLEFKELLDELQEAWNEEQRRRHEFWAEVDENRKAEFILGEDCLPFADLWTALDVFHSFVEIPHSLCL